MVDSASLRTSSLGLSILLGAITSVARADLQAHEVTPVIEGIQFAATRLGLSLGKKIEVDRDLARFQVLIEQRNASDMSVVSELARDLDASVVVEGDHLRITRTKQDLDRLANQRVARGSRALNDFFDSFDAIRRSVPTLGSSVNQTKYILEADRKALKESGNREGEDPVNRGFPLAPFSPAGRLAICLARALGIKQLAAIADGGVSLFSNHPACDELPLPDFSDAYNSFVADHQALTQVGIEVRVASSVGAKRPQHDAPEYGAVKVVLRVSRNRDQFSILVYVYTERGELVDCGGSDMNLDLFWNDGLVPVRTAMRDPGATWRDLPPADSRWLQFGQIGRTWRHPLGNAQLVASRLAQLPVGFNEPTADEPLNGFVLDALKEVVDDNPSKPFIAVVPDSLFPMVSLCISGSKINVNAVRALIASKGARLKSLDSGQFRSLVPLDTSNPNDLNCSRQVLRDFARSVSRHRLVSLRDVALLTENGGWLSRLWLDAASGVYPGLEPSGDEPTLKLLGSLSDDDFAECVSRGGVHPSSSRSISLTRLRLIGNVLSNETVSPQVVPDEYRILPCELLENGDYSSVPISIQSESSAVFSLENPSRRGTNFQSPSEIGSYVGSRVKHIFENVSKKLLGNKTLVELIQRDLAGQQARYRLARQHLYRFILGDASRTHLEVPFTMYDEVSDEQVRFEDLDKSIQQKILDSAIEAAKGG